MTCLAVRATSAHVFSIKATRLSSRPSEQWLSIIHTIASMVATSSSSAAANVVIGFSLIAAEKRASAFETRRRTGAASTSQCFTFGLSMVMVKGRTWSRYQGTVLQGFWREAPHPGRSDPGPDNLFTRCRATLDRR